MTSQPNDVRIRMPDLSPTDNEVTLVRWHVRVGETVALGQPLLEVETAKAVMDVESVAAGVLAEVLAEPGASVLIGAPIAVIAAAARPGAAAAAAAATSAAASSGVQSSRPAPRDRQRRDSARQTPAPVTASPSPSPAASPAATRHSFSARTLARRQAPAAAIAASPASPAARSPMPDARFPVPPVSSFSLAASARLPSIEWDVHAIADAALRAMGSALGLTGSGVAIVGPDGAESAAGNAAKTALLLVAVAGEGIESFRAASDPPGLPGLPVLAVSPPRLAVHAASPGTVTIEPRLPLALSASGAAIAPHHAARFLEALVKEVESL
ncbi:MAG: lipoyl domain-containing protein [Chloroflexota bacterium]